MVQLCLHSSTTYFFIHKIWSQDLYCFGICCKLKNDQSKDLKLKTKDKTRRLYRIFTVCFLLFIIRFNLIFFSIFEQAFKGLYLSRRFSSIIFKKFQVVFTISSFVCNSELITYYITCFHLSKL